MSKVIAQVSSCLRKPLLSFGTWYMGGTSLLRAMTNPYDQTILAEHSIRS
jgi:hypothetical protein